MVDVQAVRTHFPHRSNPDTSAERERSRRTMVGRAGGECLDWTVVLGRRHLERVVSEYVSHTTSTGAIGRSG